MKNNKHLRSYGFMGLTEETVLAVIKTIYFLWIENNKIKSVLDLHELIMYIGPPWTN